MAKAKPLTKPGEHGTLYRYAIEYGDDDPSFGSHTWKCWAYSSEHAIEKFEDSDEGFVPVRFARLTDGPGHLQTWHRI
jgi:hypothetical protein